MIEANKVKYLGAKGMPVIREMGSSRKIHTGLWRTERPIVDFSKCIHCKLCWLYCPDAAIEWKKELPRHNYRTCKGCGICAEECPVKCIKMTPEK